MAGIIPAGGVAASNALGADPSILPADLANTCPGGPLFYPTNRCNTRFDPQAQNALLSEVLNVVKCGGIPYDCAEYDNLCRAIGEIALDKLFNCMERDFPVAQGVCSIERLVLATDSNGCRRIMRYNDVAATLATARNDSVWGLAYPLTMHPKTGQTTVNTHIYLASTFRDALNNNNIDTNVLFGPGNQNLLGQTTINLTCESSIEIAYTQIMAFEPGQNGGNGAQSIVAIEVDGTFPQQPDGFPINFGLMSNFQAQFSGVAGFTLPAGTHTFRFFLMAFTPAEAARVAVQGSASSSGAVWNIRTSG